MFLPDSWLQHAAREGLHDPASERLADRFTSYCCRHRLVTHPLRAGMSRDHARWIRGDAMKELIDIYCHIDAKDVRKSYMAYVPELYLARKYDGYRREDTW